MQGVFAGESMANSSLHLVTGGSQPEETDAPQSSSSIRSLYLCSSSSRALHRLQSVSF